jgi:hypothetical protein
MIKSIIEITDIKDLNIPELRSKISELELKILEYPQLDIKVTHHFSKGVYAREMFMPKGTLLVGKIHKFKNLNIMSQGDIAILSIDGVERIKAPYTLVASPGAKRVFYAHEDTIWTCIHGTEDIDLEKIEDMFIAKDYNEVEIISDEDFRALKEAVCLG